MTNSKVYIVLPIHNRRESTERFVQCILRQTHNNYKMLVIDDGSNDGSSEMIMNYIPDVIHIRGKGDWWWGGSLQQAYRWLKKNVPADDIVLIMNDDSLIEDDFLSIGENILRNNPDTLLLAEAYSMQTKKLIDRGVVFDFKSYSLHAPSGGEKINCLSTRGLFLRVGDLIKLKGFRPKLLPHYYSDYEFTMRAGRKGYKLMVSDKLRLWMNEETTGVVSMPDYQSKKFLSHYFSKKYKDHPVYTFNFIMLTFPFPYNIRHGVRHIIHTIKVLLRHFLGKSAFNYSVL